MLLVSRTCGFVMIERVLFIGTQFSILYTSMYSPAGAAFRYDSHYLFLHFFVVTQNHDPCLAQQERQTFLERLNHPRGNRKVENIASNLHARSSGFRAERFRFQGVGFNIRKPST